MNVPVVPDTIFQPPEPPEPPVVVEKLQTPVVVEKLPTGVNTPAVPVDRSSIRGKTDNYGTQWRRLVHCKHLQYSARGQTWKGLNSNSQRGVDVVFSYLLW